MVKIDLTSSEIGFLWTQYVQSTMTVQILSYFLETVEDEEIKSVIQFALEFAKYVVDETSNAFKNENLPHPKGFSSEDVVLNAPKLYSDSFMLAFIETMGKAGIAAYGLSLAGSARKDLRDFFTKTTTDNMKLFNMTVDIALSKGLFLRAPRIDVQNNVEYVETNKYFSPFRNRVLNVVEITHLFENTKTNTLGEMICKSFAQITKSKEIQTFMERGKKIAQRHLKILMKYLQDSEINPPISSEFYITNSTEPIFSERLMMFLISVLNATGHGNYSTASTASMRYDLALSYQRMAIESALYAQDGSEIMVQNGWLEEPPQAPDHKEILKKS